MTATSDWQPCVSSAKPSLTDADVEPAIEEVDSSGLVPLPLRGLLTELAGDPGWPVYEPAGGHVLHIGVA
ncbi:hypothetical protein [Actinacidiphila oryziradicis]|uniref:Uncharacterized protein n=1 Tax=Actinacidiphila oryziradicis TaxID=2571141 RepID=A0A4U0SK20_9ACTN|nr:hypothetical protein [Actinacidiphila oryziradicis]TKA09503.1 hypothetical protein FCI23_21895 [Actinacidiphila oryziradicis]